MPVPLPNAAAMPTESLVADTGGPVATFQQIQQASSSQTAPVKGIQAEGLDYTDSKFPEGKDVTIFSTTGEQRTEEEFDTAIGRYNSSGGKQVEGFTFLPKDSFVRTARNFFEQGVKTEAGTPIIPGNQSMQGTISRLGQAAGTGVGTVGAVVPWLLEKAGVVPKGSAAGVQETGGRFGKNVAEAVGSTFNTPERAASTAVGVASGPIGGSASIVPQILKMAATAGTTNLATQKLFGSAEQKSFGKELTDAGKEALLLGTMQGATGVIKKLLGKGISEKANQGAATEMADLIKTKYRQFVNDPAAINAIASTEVGLRDLSQITLKGLRGSSDDIAQQFSDDVTKMVGPRTASKITQKAINQQVNKFVRASDDFLDNVGKDEPMTKARQAMQEAAADLTSAIKTHAPNLSNRASLGDVTLGQANQYKFGEVAGEDAVANMLFDYMKKMQGMVDNANVLHSLKVATKGGRFSLPAYQRSVIDTFKREPGSLMDSVGQVALRGKGMAGTDTSTGVNLSVGRMLGGHHPILDKLGVNVPTGTKYTGKVPGQSATSTAALNTAQQSTFRSIQDYFNEGKDK